MAGRSNRFNLLKLSSPRRPSPQTLALTSSGLSFFDVTRLLDLGETSSGAWIYSSSEPYDEESQLDMQRLRNWTDLLGLDFLGGASETEAEAAGFHASGHASGPDLQRFIEIVNPRTLIPIHLQSEGLRFYRRTFGETAIRVAEPGSGRALTIE